MHRSKLIAGCMALLAAPVFAQANQNFALAGGTLVYKVTHPIHVFEATSKDAKGKGFCHEQVCDFLIAAPVKSFDSGDTNRDLHMLQVTKGGDFPMVLVRFQIPRSKIDDPSLDVKLEVEFAGQKVQYDHVQFSQTVSGGAHHVTGTIPATVKDFKIDPPSFFTVPIKNEIPVHVDLTWKPI